MNIEYCVRCNNQKSYSLIPYSRCLLRALSPDFIMSDQPATTQEIFEHLQQLTGVDLQLLQTSETTVS